MEVKKAISMRMEVKEAIEFLEGIKPNSYEKNAKDKIKKILIDRGIITKTNEELKGIEGKYITNIDEVIDLLQQGEAYRLILKALDKNYGHYLIGVKDNKEVGGSYTIRDLMDISYQKYFPKEE